jgi:hypothetical protein
MAMGDRRECMPDTTKALSGNYDKGQVVLKGASQGRVAVMIEVIFILVSRTYSTR